MQSFNQSDSNEPSRFVAFYGGNENQWMGAAVDAYPWSAVTGFQSSKPLSKDTVYVRHPLNLQELVSLADYDLELLRAKVKVADEALSRLGATKVEIFSFSGTSEELKAVMGVGFPTLDSVGVKGGASKTTRWSLYSHWTAIGSNPRDPRPLALTDIEGLEAACDGVIHNGRRTWQQMVHASISLTLDPGLTTGFKNVGLNFGLDVKKERTNVLYFDVTFFGQKTNVRST